MKKFSILLLLIIIAGCADQSSDISLTTGTSQGGSLARFAVAKNHLYIVDQSSLIPIDISNIEQAVVKDKVGLGFDIETIFPYGDNLFIGSRSAVHVLSIEKPSAPEYLSMYSHSTGCDPVVVQGNTAYVTLKEGLTCTNVEALNVLEVVDMSDLIDPTRISSFNMTSPGGLGIGCNQKLYVCEGQFGLVKFDISDPLLPVREETYPEIRANDIIIKDNLMIITSNDGIYQYDCSSGSPVPLSKIDIYL